MSVHWSPWFSSFGNNGDRDVFSLLSMCYVSDQDGMFDAVLSLANLHFRTSQVAANDVGTLF